MTSGYIFSSFFCTSTFKWKCKHWLYWSPYLLLCKSKCEWRLLLFLGTCRSVQDSDQFTLESDISSTEWIMWKKTKNKQTLRTAVWTQPCWISTVLLALHMYYLQQTSTTKQDKHMKKTDLFQDLFAFTYIYIYIPFQCIHVNCTTSVAPRGCD